MGKHSKLALLGGTPVITEEEAKPRWPCIDEDDIEAVVYHLRYHHISAYEVVSGPLFDFEAELREYFKVKHALLVSSGTAALYSAFFSLNIGRGDEVIVPAMTFPGTGAPVFHLGGSVRLVDVDPETGNPGIEHIRKAMTNRTRAVVLAHAWGLPADLKSISAFLGERNIALVEDAARAFGTKVDQLPAGGHGTIGTLSLHELKAVPGGEGGLFLTNDREHYERAVSLGHYSRCKDITHLRISSFTNFRDSGLGLNFQIHPLAAALARCQFHKLEKRLETMRRNRAELVALTKDLPKLFIQQIPPWAEEVSFYGFNFHWRPPLGEIAPSRDTLVKALQAEGVPASRPGTPPLHRLPLYRAPETGWLRGHCVGVKEDGAFPGATMHYRTLLRLPTLFGPSQSLIRHYANALEKVLYSAEELAAWEKKQH